MSLFSSKCDPNLKVAPGFVMGGSWFEHMRWPWQNGKDNGQWIDPSTVLTFNQQFLREPGYARNYSVSYGATLVDVITNTLPSTATPAINHGTKVAVKISWSSSDYDPNKAGDYTFTGVVDLKSVPEGYTYDGATISTTVTVKPQS